MALLSLAQFVPTARPRGLAEQVFDSILVNRCSVHLLLDSEHPLALAKFAIASVRWGGEEILAYLTT